MVMAEAERAGGGQNDMEKELTCSVSLEFLCWRILGGAEVGAVKRIAAMRKATDGSYGVQLRILCLFMFSLHADALYMIVASASYTARGQKLGCAC
jgi:hypothetical protein